MSHPKDPKDDLGFALPEPAKLSPARAVVIGTVTAALLGGAFLAAWLPRRHAQKELAAETTQTSSERLRVDVVVPKVASSDRALSLPGAIQPLERRRCTRARAGTFTSGTSTSVTR